ncbi:MAG: hypothetical protein ABFD18_04395 [Syntrophomonas sp.]
MHDLGQKFAAWRQENPGSPEEEFIRYMNQELLALYPGLIIRWSRIYGSRWAYLWGTSDGIALNPVKVALNHNYGICIDNPEIFIDDELEKIVFNLKESFINVAHC